MTRKNSWSRAELLLHPRDGVDLVPGVVRQGRAPGYTGQVHRASLLDSVDPTHRVRLTETVDRRLGDDDVAGLTEAHLPRVAIAVPVRMESARMASMTSVVPAIR